MTTTTTRPCWHCGTRHQSDTMPALCSDPCIAAWQKRYQIAFGDQPAVDTIPRHTNEPCRVHIVDEHRVVERPLVADPKPTCRVYEVDGQPVLVRSSRAPTEKDLAALAEFRELLKTQASLRTAIAAQQATEQKEAPGG